jgi:hypothetical protein
MVGVNNQGIEFLGSCGIYLEKWAGKWYRGNKKGLEGWVGPLRKMVSNDRYHCGKGEKGNPMV